MGNWRTVSLRGTLAEEDVPRAVQFATPKDDWSNLSPLSISDGFCSLGIWPHAVINADGNLFERDYSVEDVAESLQALVQVAPSLALKVHCGGEWESDECVATITVADGDVTVGPPEVPAVRGASDDAMLGRLFRAMHKQT